MRALVAANLQNTRFLHRFSSVHISPTGTVALLSWASCPIGDLSSVVDFINVTLSLSNGAVAARWHFGSVAGSTVASLWQWRFRLSSINASNGCHVFENIGFGVLHDCSGEAPLQISTQQP
jgi:hypothetical protein